MLPIDRTSKSSLDTNLVNGNTSDAPVIKNSNDVVYNTIDELNAKVDGLVGSSALSPYPPSFLSRQALINGNFDVWQRGTSFNSPASGTYTADRFKIGSNVIDSNVRVLQSSVVPNGQSKYSCRLEVFSAAGGGGALTTLDQYIEDYSLFAGQKVTLSGYVKCDPGASIIPFIYDGVNTPSGPTINATVWTKFSFTVTIVNSPTALRIFLQFNRGGLAVGVGVNFAQIQLNIGNAVLPFQPKSFAEELAQCLRYYEKSYDYATAPATATSIFGIEQKVVPSSTISVSQPYGKVSYKTPKRTVGTVTIYPYTTPTNTGRVSTNGGTDLGANSAGVTYNGISGFSVYNNSGVALTTIDSTIIFHWASDAEL